MRNNTKLIIFRRTIFVLLILLTHILQNTKGWFPEIFSARAFLLIPLTVCLGMFEREFTGAVLGAFAGALWDSVFGLADGYNALFLMLIGGGCGLLINVFMRNHLLTALILSGSATLLYTVLYVLFFVTAQGMDSAGWLFLRFYLPSAVYTVIFTPIYYIIVRSLMRLTRTAQEF